MRSSAPASGSRSWPRPWQAVRDLLDDPARKPPAGVRTLLGGLARCRCGNTVLGNQSLAAGRHVYRCNPASRAEGTTGQHCSTADRAMGSELPAEAIRVDEYVIRVVCRLLARDTAEPGYPEGPDPGDRCTPRPTAIRASLDEMAADKALGLVTRYAVDRGDHAGEHPARRNHRPARRRRRDFGAGAVRWPPGPRGQLWDSLDNSPASAPSSPPWER